MQRTMVSLGRRACFPRARSTSWTPLRQCHSHSKDNNKLPPDLEGLPTTQMALSTSPRKLVPLATGDDWLSVAKPSASVSGPTTVKRVFFCGVVVESTENGRRLPEGVYWKFSIIDMRSVIV